MAKVKIKSEEELKEARRKLKDVVSFSKTKCGVVAAKWPRKKRKSLKR